MDSWTSCISSAISSPLGLNAIQIRKRNKVKPPFVQAKKNGKLLLVFGKCCNGFSQSRLIFIAYVYLIITCMAASPLSTGPDSIFVCWKAYICFSVCLIDRVTVRAFACVCLYARVRSHSYAHLDLPSAATSWSSLLTLILEEETPTLTLINNPSSLEL